MEAFRGTPGGCACASDVAPAFPSHLPFIVRRSGTMSEAARHQAINYVEFSTTDIATTKKFYTAAFGWRLQDWGSEYISWDKGPAGIDGGFRLREKGAETGLAAPLIVLYSK